ncbi:Lrp/AsnC family transcriptional regulator [Sphingomonas sp. KRR8]|uniref:Lrp/AsnC family transcriptional regulator n=1 Tax=Sphingomonas sp. KRR8 TaxID=2942996 RepID=UPI0020221072|nr:Lrp/AsnC family transcriptional regulator [Sphingomonas sp. KRR8]URD59976.1 Lrp/AsnC family transcriptional regulator [Sphingomonas sp. KRR8]
MRFAPEFGTNGRMLDEFDLALLEEVQHDDGRTADQLAERVALSPSAIARRLRRLRGEGWVRRTVALLSPRLTERRLRALVLVQLAEHADQARKAALLRRLDGAPEVQFAYEIAGSHDLVLLLDCADMDDFVATAEGLLAVDSTVRRYESLFVKRELKFAPFVRLSGRRPAY